MNVARILVAVTLVAVLAGVNHAVMSREATLREGATLYLELAPVDPRSIMQGDYMALRFAVGDRLRGKEVPPRGRIVVARDAKGVGRFVRLDRGEPLADGELRLEYRIRQRGPRIVTDAWFFQEGQGDKFAQARYGELRVDANGVALLTAMRDKDLALLGTR